MRSAIVWGGTACGVLDLAAAVYVVVSRVLRILTAQPALCGLLYGGAVYLFMYGVVLRVRFGAVPLTASGIVIPMFCVGLPIALAARYAR